MAALAPKTGGIRSAERGGPAWHPLIDHCTDVACVLEALLASRPCGEG